MNRVVVFSPSRYSLYTIAVTELLMRQGVEVSAMVVRRLVNPRRLINEFRRDGSRLLRKIARKLLLREHGYVGRDFETLPDLLKSEDIRSRKVDELREAGMKILYVSDLNDDPVVELLDKTIPDLIVFTGGGILREPILARAGSGVVNCHSGILPAYRGMDVIEWAILENRLDQVGISVHFMAQGVDTGDILRLRQIELPPGIELSQVRDLFEPLMSREIVTTCVDFLEGNLDRRPQRLEDGKQYFAMHPSLRKITEKKFKSLNAGPAPRV